MSYISHCIMLDSIQYNFSTIQNATTATVGAVVKANAYGHGAKDVALALQDVGCSIFFSGTIKESIELRKASVTGTIFPLLGFSTKEEILLCTEYQLTPVVHSMEQLPLVQGYVQAIAIKCDTGMNRLGFTREELPNLIALCTEYGISIDYLFSHLSMPNNNEHSAKQQNEFEAIRAILIQAFPTIQSSLASSCGTAQKKSLDYDIVRSGIALYGYESAIEGIVPSMEIYTKILQIRTLKKGDFVSYNNIFTADTDMKIAVVACGYADGYHRNAHKGYVIIEGEKAPILGTICMQSFMVDITHIPCASSTSTAYILSPQQGLCATTIAKQWNTISYEVLCSLGK